MIALLGDHAAAHLLTAWCPMQVDACVVLGSEEQLVLPGYGVEAVLKNMEYSAMDDKTAAKLIAASSADTDVGSEAPEQLGEVKGFMFDTLVTRKPHLRQELLTFRDTLMSSDDEETLKVCGGWRNTLHGQKTC